MGVSEDETPGDEHFRKLERMYLGARTNAYYRPEIRVRAAAAEIRIAVRPEFCHPAGSVHGSVYFKALDDAAFFACNSLVDDVFLLTADFHVYLTRAISDGVLVAHGEVTHRSRRRFIGDAVLRNEAGDQVARGSGTFARSRVPLSPEMGYA